MPDSRLLHSYVWGTAGSIEAKTNRFEVRATRDSSSPETTDRHVPDKRPIALELNKDAAEIAGEVDEQISEVDFLTAATSAVAPKTKKK
jgi:hypothetical protein